MTGIRILGAGLSGLTAAINLAKKHFRNRLKAGVVNRYLWENILYKKDYSMVINIAEFVKKNIYSMHNYNLLQRMIYPLALFNLEKKYPKLKL